MKLTPGQIKKILKIATASIDRPYDKDFSCVDFVRYIYRRIGIEIPKLNSNAPPSEFNITKEQLKNPPVGYPMFLKDRDDPREYRSWTHVAIIMPCQCCIHCSLFFGKKVVVSSIEEMFRKYDFADSDVDQSYNLSTYQRDKI